MSSDSELAFLHSAMNAYGVSLIAYSSRNDAGYASWLITSTKVHVAGLRWLAERLEKRYGNGKRVIK
jgi:hypothetical protein